MVTPGAASTSLPLPLSPPPHRCISVAERLTIPLVRASSITLRDWPRLHSSGYGCAIVCGKRRTRDAPLSRTAWPTARLPRSYTPPPALVSPGIAGLNYACPGVVYLGHAPPGPAPLPAPPLLTTLLPAPVPETPLPTIAPLVLQPSTRAAIPYDDRWWLRLIGWPEGGATGNVLGGR